MSYRACAPRLQQQGSCCLQNSGTGRGTSAMGQIAVRLGTNQNTSPKPKGRKIVGVPMPFCLCVCQNAYVCTIDGCGSKSRAQAQGPHLYFFNIFPFANWFGQSQSECFSVSMRTLLIQQLSAPVKAKHDLFYRHFLAGCICEFVRVWVSSWTFENHSLQSFRK